MGQNLLCPSLGEETFINPSYFRRLGCRPGVILATVFCEDFQGMKNSWRGWDENIFFVPDLFLGHLRMVSPIPSFEPAVSEWLSKLRCRFRISRFLSLQNDKCGGYCLATRIAKINGLVSGKNYTPHI